MASPLKYAPADPDLTLKNRWDKLKMTDRRINILANGTADQYMKKLWKNSIVATVVAAVLLSVGILAFLLFVLGQHDEQSGMVVAAFFAGGTVVLPIAAWWLLLLIFSRQSHITCKTLIHFGQNKAFDLSVAAVKKKIITIRWICAVTAVISGAAIFGCAAAIHDFVVRVCICAVLNILFAASLYFLTLGLRNVGKKAALVGEYACEGCGYVNTVFFGGSYDHNFGPEETRVVNASPTTYTAGTVYDNQGNKVGTVTGNTTTYTYAVGRSYEYTVIYRCACCGKDHSFSGKSFKEERRYKG